MLDLIVLANKTFSRIEVGLQPTRLSQRSDDFRARLVQERVSDRRVDEPSGVVSAIDG